ncbi:MAG: TRAP transporter small permease [Desulfarculus sp.]|nr:MAG: TRAP transporter small permease [Desulfarculus sp.]
MDWWLKLVDQLVGVLKRLGGAALVGMMVVTCVDVIFRYFGRPIFGAVEIVSFMATILLACAMPLTDREKGHVGVDLFVRRLPPRAQHLVDSVTGALSTFLFALVAWQMFLYARAMKASGEVSMSLEFPSYLLVYVVAVAFAVLSLVILSELIQNLGKLRRS